MPLYDYGCPECGAENEVQHTVGEIGKIKVLCDACGSSMKKLLSVPALIGFDDVGRSRSRKEKEEVAKKDTTNKDSSKKDTSANKETKKDAAA
jgi:putative FmdB family regulatory protein